MITRRDELSGMDAACARLAKLFFKAAIVLSAISLGACASLNPVRWLAGRPEASVVTSMTPDTIANAARASASYERNPRSARAAIDYAKALRELGNNTAAADVLGRTARYHPDNAELMGEYAKALTAAGESESALEVFRTAENLNRRDWSLLSAEGIALDQLGRHRDARERYTEALKLSPNNPDVMCNLALSHTLSGNLTEAEVILRRAVRQPGSGAQARQNLALVLGLSGRFSEAEGLVRADLDPTAADHNVALLKEMFARPEMWVAAREQDAVQKIAAATSTPAALPAIANGEPAPLRAVSQMKLTTPSSGITGATAPRIRAPAAQSRAVRQTAPAPEGNGIDETFFDFGW